MRLEVRVDGEHLKTIGEWKNDIGSCSYLEAVEERVFETGEASKIHYGWKDGCNMEVSEMAASEFTERCLSLARDDSCGLEESTAMDMIAPLRVGSAKAHKDNHIQRFLQMNDKSARKRMANGMGPLLRSTSDSLDKEKLMEYLLDVAIYCIDKENRQFAWTVIEHTIAEELRENPDVETKSNDYFDGVGSSLFSTQQSVDLLNIVCEIEEDYEGNPVVSKPIFPCASDKVNYHLRN